MNARFHPQSPSLPTRAAKGPIPVLVLLLTFFAVPATAANAGPTLSLSDGQGPINKLTVGDDLWVAASGLPPLLEVRIVLRDEQGQTILERQEKTSYKGRLPTRRFWARTGIGGCGCEDLGQGYPFVMPSEADVLIGHTLKVSIETLQSAQPLITRPLPIIARERPLLFLTVGVGCPQQLFAAEESIFLSSDRRTEHSIRVFIVHHAESWSVGDVLLDQRPIFPEGQVLPAAPEGRLDELVVAPGDLHPAIYDIVWRPGGGDGDILQPGDQVMTLPDFRLGGGSQDRSDGGMVIDDWGCDEGTLNTPIVP